MGAGKALGEAAEAGGGGGRQQGDPFRPQWRGLCLLVLLLLLLLFLVQVALAGQDGVRQVGRGGETRRGAEARRESPVVFISLV